jgi:hypothetical protein
VNKLIEMVSDWLDRAPTPVAITILMLGSLAHAVAIMIGVAYAFWLVFG